MPGGDAMSCDIKLEVGAGSAPGQFTTRVVDSPSGGEPSASFELDVDDLLRERDALENTVLASGALGRRIVPAHEQQLQRVGTRLFDALFSGRVLGTYRASLGVARQCGEPLRVVLRLTAPRLAALPWEALFDSETQHYLCRKEPLVRHVPAPFTPQALDVAPPLRVLGLVSSPRGMPALDVAAEQQRLSEALATPIAEGLIDLEWLAQASWNGVQEKLLSNHWHVLHFIGHGDYDVASDQGVIALVGENDRANLVEAEQLADLLNEARPTPRLVVLNSCSSGEQGTQDLFSSTAAALVRSGISAVAAMQFTVSDTAAIAFARGFYTAIAHGRSVDDASRSGRISMAGTRSSLEWVTPVLYVRGESTQLFNLPTHPPPAETRQAIVLAQLRALYVDACAAIRAEDFAAATGLLDELLSLDPGYHDAAALRDSTVRRRDLADKFKQAIDAQAAKDWSTAARLYTQIVELQPNYRDAVVRRQKAQRIIDLQDKLRIHAGSKNWRAVIDVNDDLSTLDPDAADPDGLATKARSALRAQAQATEIEERYKLARAVEEAGDWTTAISHYRSLTGYRDAETRLRACQTRLQEAARRQALVGKTTPYGIVSDAPVKVRFWQSSLGLPATLIAVAALTGAFPPMYVLSKDYPAGTDDVWHWQTASRILIAISFCFLAWMAKSLGDRRAMLSAALMAPVIVLHVINDQMIASGDLPVDLVDFLRKIGYPTVLALAAMVGILFGVAVIRKYRFTWAGVLIAWGVCGLLEAYLSYLAKIAPWWPGEPPAAAWKAADSVLVVQNLILLAVAIFMYLESRRSRERTRVGIGPTLPNSRVS
jgi:tetratricopeptide (TPR) repeat protein